MPERDEDNKEYASNLMNAVLRYADNSLIELNRRGLPCESVRIGTGWLNNLIKNTIQKYEKEGLVEKPSNINIDYILEHNLYSDAKHEQYVLSSTELIKKHKNILKNISTYENYN